MNPTEPNKDTPENQNIVVNPTLSQQPSNLEDSNQNVVSEVNQEELNAAGRVLNEQQIPNQPTNAAITSQNGVTQNTQFQNPVSAVVFSSEPTEPESTTPRNINNLESPKKKSKFWVILSLVLAFLTIAPTVLYYFIIFGLAKDAENGMSGTEFIAMAMLPLALLSPLMMVVDFIAAIVYIIRRKPRGKKLIFPIIVIILPIIYVGYTVWVLYYSFSGAALEDYYKEQTITKEEAINKIQNCEVEYVGAGFSDGTYPPSLSLKNYENVYINEADLPEIDAAAKQYSEKCGGIKTSKASSGGTLMTALSVSEATSVLNSCKVIGFYYPGSFDNNSEELNQINALNNKTGIYLASDLDDNPIRIHIEQNQIQTMVPIARNAQKTCPNLQFWNGRYEQRQEDGTWR